MFFFFKQKTAYEMRISDCSSDVCSSDLLDFRRFMPPTLVTRSIDEVRQFMAEHGAIVVKPIHGNGGKAIFRVPESGENLSALIEVFNQMWPEPHMEIGRASCRERVCPYV